MFGKFLTKIFGSRNQRIIKKMRKDVLRINALEPTVQQLSDEALRAKTAEFKQRLAQGETLEQLLPEAFAVVREASRRTLGLRHFDVQLIGGMVLHSGKIAEMRTGEGKTLVATLPTYLNALAGKGVHIVTVNDYLARRDAKWMEPIYEFLGMTVGVILSQQPQAEKRAAYQADITYGTNNEFGFDYLRDNMAFSLADKVQRELYYAVVDEVDSILIDEARTPLIISGPTEDNSELYQAINKLIPRLERGTEKEQVEWPRTSQQTTTGDYVVDEKNRQAYLTEQGQERIEQILIEAGLMSSEQSLYSTAGISLLHHIQAGLRAHTLFQRDVDYIVRDDQVIIVDEHTGRTMIGRRWSDGLHQAVEAKEGVRIQNENQTLASITFQNYFRLYKKLSGMTGTADTEAYELQHIYNLEVIVIPTNQPMIRKDHGDLIFLTKEEKFKEIVKHIEDCCKRGQPVLVGTASIETSEYLSTFLDKHHIKHQVLNAKFHEKEAEIIAQAGRPGTVTIATNMAGRGTDIVLGGSLQAEISAMVDATDLQITQAQQAWQQRHDQVLNSGGLCIIGTERHESRRIDNQLRGRSGRQGDPGESRFYLSLEDNLMRIFASDRMAAMMQKLGWKEDEAIEHPWVTRAIENAQRKVEARNFDIRKQLLEYDDVANDQRKVIYEQRNELLSSEDISGIIAAFRDDVLQSAIHQYIPPHSVEDEWNAAGLEERLAQDFSLKLPLGQWLAEDGAINEESLTQKILAEALAVYKSKQSLAGEGVMRHFEKSVLLQSLDRHWKGHLAAMDHLRQGIHLRGYAQKNPKQEYKREAFQLFTEMLDNLKHEVVSIVSRVEIREESDVQAVEEKRRQAAAQPMQYQHAETSALAEDKLEEDQASQAAQPYMRETPKVGRNDVCPCGSGRKYKHCHGRL